MDESKTRSFEVFLVSSDCIKTNPESKETIHIISLEPFSKKRAPKSIH